MNSLPTDIVLIYYKRKHGMSLTEDEQAAWDNFSEALKVDEETIEQNIQSVELFGQKTMSWEQFQKKHNMPIAIPYPEKQENATGRLHQRSFRFKYLSAAASLILVLIVAWMFFVRPAAPGEAMPQANSQQIPKGLQPPLILSDGTKVWLNADTDLRYPKTFGEGERVVELDHGEAYFEVAKRSAAQPFIVRHQKQTIQVLGTHFNVRAYANEAAIITTLLEGLVRITGGEQDVVLIPGQQARLDRQGQGRLQIVSADTVEAIAWKNYYFEFNHKPLSEIMKEVARWYDMEVVYKTSVTDYSFTIDRCSRNEPLSALLDALEAARLVHFKIDGQTIYVSK